MAVGDDAALDLDADGRSKCGARFEAHCREHDIDPQYVAVGQCDGIALFGAIHGLRAGAEMPLHAERGEPGLQQRAAFRGQQPAQCLLRNVDDVHAVALGGEVVGEFTADQTGADDGDAFFAGDGGAEARVIVKVVDGQDAAGRISCDLHADLVGAQRQHQFRVSQLFITDADGVRGGVDGVDAGVRAHGGVQLRGHLFRRVQRNGFGCFFRSQRIGQHGLGIKRAAVAGEDDQRGGGVEFAQFLGGVVTREAAADDDDGMHCVSMENQRCMVSNRTITCCAVWRGTAPVPRRAGRV